MTEPTSPSPAWIIACLIATGCGATDVSAPAEKPLTDESASEDAEHPASTRRAETEFEAFLRETSLSIMPPEAQRHSDVLGPLLTWKTERGKEVHSEWEIVIRDGDPDTAQLAFLRIGQAYLNLGCEIAASPAPARLRDDDRQKYREVLQSAALDVLQTAGEALQRAAEMSSDRHRSLVDAVSADWPQQPSDVPSTCADKRAHWTTKDPMDPKEIYRIECEAGTTPFCWLWARYADGGTPALKKSCAADFARGCKELGDRHVLPTSGPPNASAAESAYTRACDLGFEEACRAQLAVVDPDRQTDYRESCLAEDDAVACLKYSRLLDSGRLTPTMWSRCTDDATMPDENEALEECRAGNAASCAIRASYLQVDATHDISLPDPDGDEDIDALAIRCIEGDDAACRAGASVIAAGNPGDRACASILLLQACRRGSTDDCGFADVSMNLSGD